MIRGSCLCGAVKFEISEEPSSLSYCHCTRCRKAAGIFSAVLIGNASDLKVTQGEGFIQDHPPSADGKHRRCFCNQCGTSLGDLHTGDIYVVAASALDDEPKIKPLFHMFTGAKPDWYEINDGLKQFERDYAPD